MYVVLFLPLMIFETTVANLPTTAFFASISYQDEKYYRHTGHPGGIKVTTPEKLHDKKPGETLKMAVKRMLPGGVLGRKQLTKLKIYTGNDHPHSAQNPTVIE